MKYFYCYSVKLKNFLLSQDVKFLTKDHHNKTGNPYWVFLRNEELDKYLSKWEMVKNL